MAVKKQTIFNSDTLIIESTDGEGKCYQTPLFFVQKGQSVYIRLPASSPKVERVNCNDQVNIATTDTKGNCRGDWVSTLATVHDEREFRWLFWATINKYGGKPLLSMFVKWVRRGFKSKQYCVLKLEVEEKNGKR